MIDVSTACVEVIYSLESRLHVLPQRISKRQSQPTKVDSLGFKPSSGLVINLYNHLTTNKIFSRKHFADFTMRGKKTRLV